MPYPYKKMQEEDFDYIRSVTGNDRVWVVMRSQENIITMKCRNMG